MADVQEGYVFACDMSDVPSRGKKTVQIDDATVLIVACSDRLFAVEDRCPQTGRSIARGKVLNSVISSPHTGARYSLETGQYVGGGQSFSGSHWLTVLPVQVIDDRLYVDPSRL
jgi:nitrite reductase/ring-hydroxylating ferredoxin subunit